MNDYPTPEQEPLEPTDSEKKLIKELRSNPLLADQINGLMAEFDDDIANGMSADEAEEKFVLTLQQLGQTMMQQWAQNTQREALRRAKEHAPGLVTHSKKNSTGRQH